MLLAIAGSGCGGPPSDAVMIAHLQQEREAFETIAKMMTDDRIVGGLTVGALPGHSPQLAARRERYRALLQRTGCRTIVRAPEGRITFDHPFALAGGGVAGSGFKEYVYAPTPPSPLRPTLDLDDGRRFEDTFRHVDGCWYLSRMRV